MSNSECMANFIDLIGFDSWFTKRIMNGETSIHEETLDWEDQEQNLHSDLFSLWNLILSAD